VLEIGCGSGCVAVSIALASPGAHVVATDVSEDALEVARTNVAALAPGRVDLRQGDLFAPVEHEAPFHVVVSNPPYVGAAELAHVDRAVKEHEPASAWLAGDDPLRFHVRILDAATARVAPGGAVLLELGSGARRLVAEARARIPGSTAAILRDLSGAPRVARIDLPA
jgi:HemK-like putative methylase